MIVKFSELQIGQSFIPIKDHEDYRGRFVKFTKTQAQNHEGLVLEFKEYDSVFLLKPVKINTAKYL